MVICGRTQNQTSPDAGGRPRTVHASIRPRGGLVKTSKDENNEQEIGDQESVELEGLFGMIHGPISNCPFKNVLSQIHLIIERILEIINSDTSLQNTGTPYW